ncbi:MAG: HAD family hydrolase [Anaerolineae bacterium]|nr:HAD family hydrolase [Anaerolineae bacterium]
MKHSNYTATDLSKLREIHNLIIDMDGVLYRGNAPMPGLTDFFAFMREKSIRFTLATNNSSRTPEEYVAKLAGMGVTVSPEDILTSGIATADYLSSIAPPGTKVYVIGAESLAETMRKYGFEVSDRDAAFVVVGMDTQVTYDKLRRATLLIRAGARFIGTNPDKTFPSEEGIVPGNGAILAAIETATGVTPLTIGKPEPTLFEMALKRMSADPAHTAVLGDRLETDILGGINAGLLTILVLSGVVNREELAVSEVKPDLVFEDIDHLRHAWLTVL